MQPGGCAGRKNLKEMDFISVDSLTLFPDTELYRMEQEGRFVPAGEKERLLYSMSSPAEIHCSLHDIP